MDAPARQFRIGQCLGRGGFGEVYRATMVAPSGLATEVALKVLRSDLEPPPDAARRLVDEGRLLGRMNHPVIVRAYDLARVDGRLGLVTEFVDGDDLDRCLHGAHQIRGRALLTAIGQVASALHAAWSTVGPDGAPMGIVHRDLKPSNVRIGRHGQVKLLDFGIARFAADPQDHTRTDLVVGSVAYMAPERFEERSSDAASDVFGLGCVLYEGLVGDRFHPDGRMAVVPALAKDSAAFARHRDARLERLAGPPALTDLVAACLAFDPAARPTSEDVARVCEEVAEALGGPSLRRLCAERAWGPPEPVTGSLEGRVLVEGELGLPRPEERPAGAPRKLSTPQGTADPEHAGLDVARLAALERIGERARGLGGPEALDAPRAPSLPIGVTLLAEEPRIVSADSIDRPRTPSGSVSSEHTSELRPWVAGIGAAGCVTLLGLAVAAGGLVLLIGWVALG